MKREDEAYERLAESIADGRAVDPRKIEATDVEGSAIVANLISLSKLSEFHRVPDPGRIVRDSPDSATDVWGHLRVLEKVGQGAFGDVFRAWDTQLHRQVALKLHRGAADDAPAARTLEEGRLLAKVDHPGVVRIHGADTQGGRSGLWMEFVEGPTLESVLRKNGPLDAAEVAGIGAQLCDALSAVHDAGLVHGDVKAQNVVRESGGRIVLMDFGAGSRQWDRDTGAPAATPMYTPPEVFAGETPTPRSDLFSLGVLLFVLLTDRFPVDAASADELREAHRTGKRQRLRDLRTDLPAELVTAVERAMEATPESRFRTASEMGAVLQRCVAPGVTGTARRVPPASRKRSIAAWALALAVAATAIAFVVRQITPSPVLIEEARLLRGSDPAAELVSGDRVETGDLLHLRIDVGRPSHVYVLNRDDRGSLSLLFPMPGYELQNPVPADRDVAVPGPRAGSRDPMAWEIGPGGGTERFLIVASRRALAPFEEAIAELPRPPEAASARPLDDAAADALYRGVAGMVRLPAPRNGADPAGRRIFELATTLAKDGGDVWVREVVLRASGRRID